MALFLLVHGAWHDSWCWDMLTPELEALGHEVACADLPGDDPSATLTDYAHAAVSPLSSSDGPAIVLGHSFGGVTIPLVTQLCRVERLVFLCAAIPTPAAQVGQALAADALMPVDLLRSITAEDGSSRWSDPEQARRTLFWDCPKAVADDAIGRLRSQSGKPLTEKYPLSTWPSVPSTFICGDADPLLDTGTARREAQRRLATTPVELPGGHSPFLARPEVLARTLDRVAAR